MRFLILVGVVVFSTFLSANGQESQDCGRWEYKGVKPGMNLSEAKSRSQLLNRIPPRPKHARGRWSQTWLNSDNELVEVVVNYGIPDSEVLGLDTVITRWEHYSPYGFRKIDPYQFLREQWGPPTSKETAGPVTHYSWIDTECNVKATLTKLLSGKWHLRLSLIEQPRTEPDERIRPGL